MKKRIPIGVSNFKKLKNENYYFVDKSIFIKDIIDDGSEVILIPRPRRFGKTVNMSMLKYFFEKTPEDNCELFQDLKIWKEEGYRQYCGKYPVIYISFKDIKYNYWKDSLEAIQMLISDEYKNHKYLVSADSFEENELEYFNNIITQKVTISDVVISLKKLTEYLYKHHKERVVIIIDEYDTPIECSYVKGFYTELIDFMKNFLGGCLKDNVYLEKGILTGILRVAKESIFSGLNNLKVSTILDGQYGAYFGLLEEEVSEVLEYYKVEKSRDEIKRWYNGYIFGGNTVYNPWSILNAADNCNEFLRPYWVNTSGNDLVKKLITRGNSNLKKELENLLRGSSIVKEINENIVYKDVDEDSNSIWSFLLFNGYLKCVDKRLEDTALVCELCIPNLEVRLLYRQIVKSWFSESINNDKYDLMMKSLINGDIKTFSKVLKEFVFKTFSYFDTCGQESEKTYHAFVLGLLVSLDGTYEVKSNKESGYGRYDVMLIPKDTTKLGIVFEFKSVDQDDNETLDISADLALKQIEGKKYSQELMDRGVNKVFEVGIAFQGKDVLVKWREIIG